MIKRTQHITLQKHRAEIRKLQLQHAKDLTDKTFEVAGNWTTKLESAKDQAEVIAAGYQRQVDHLTDRIRKLEEDLKRFYGVQQKNADLEVVLEQSAADLLVVKAKAKVFKKAWEKALDAFARERSDVDDADEMMNKLKQTLARVLGNCDKSNEGMILNAKAYNELCKLVEEQ